MHKLQVKWCIRGCNSVYVFRIFNCWECSRLVWKVGAAFHHIIYPTFWEVNHPYFPPAKTARFWNKIRSFSQFDGESIHDASEKVQDLVAQMPTRCITKMDAATYLLWWINFLKLKTTGCCMWGSLHGYLYWWWFNLVEKIAWNNYNWQSKGTHHPKKVPKCMKWHALQTSIPRSIGWLLSWLN